MNKTKIPWTIRKHDDGTIIDGATFNIVWGCDEVEPEGACRECYARVLATRYGYDVWGHDKPRKTMSAQYWKQPLKWQRDLEKLGHTAFVFCSSMADVFENHPTVKQEREKLWPLIKQTPNLVWLLLTKRVANIPKMLPADWSKENYPNVWLGTTCGTQKRVIEVERLAKIDCVRRFVSIEPLLEPIDFGDTLATMDWILIGGESGHKARKMEKAWVEDILDQAAKYPKIHVFMKQLGTVLAKELRLKDKKGEDIVEWPSNWCTTRDTPPIE
jgi:protein gp37